MLVWLFEWLEQFYSAFNVFGYVTLRAILGTLTALVTGLVFGPWMIRRLQILKVGQPIRELGPETHLSKAGTPTMGGTLILLGITVATLLWSKLDNPYVWILLLTTLAFGVIGGVDDYLKLKKKNSDGLSAKAKYGAQSLVGIAVAFALYYTMPADIQPVLIPYIPSTYINLGWLFIPFVYFVVVGTSNAVNLTDGLDGLAIMPTIMVGTALGAMLYAADNVTIGDYLSIPNVAGASELVVFGAALVGAGLAFLWFNTYPAQVFMGDVGALALGAGLGVMAVVARQELVLFIMGGVFVVETLSVILQVGSFKLTGKRIFRMAPLHHHFELKGWPEPRVIVRFWIVTVILVLIGLASLKIR